MKAVVRVAIIRRTTTHKGIRFRSGLRAVEWVALGPNPVSTCPSTSFTRRNIATLIRCFFRGSTAGRVYACLVRGVDGLDKSDFLSADVFVGFEAQFDVDTIHARIREQLV